MKIRLLSILVILLYGYQGNAMENDSIPNKRKGEFVILPATAYTPETSFTVGAFSQYYFDFARDTNARMSFVQLGGIYTLRNQMYVGADVNLITKNEDYIFNFSTKYSNFSDRDYGLGNDATALVYQYDFKENQVDSMNFMDFKYQSYGIQLVGLRKVRKGLYAGLHYWYENLWDYGQVADSLSLIRYDADRDEFAQGRLDGTRSGFAWVLAYDDRKNSNNPLKGTYVQFRNWYYRGWLGSDYDYTSVSLDARHYINTYKEHVLALRFRNEQRYPMNGSIIPKFDMARVGGKDFARGYYDGTYIDNHLLAFELEYRLPLWQDPDASIWKFWKRLGIVAFASGSRVYGGWDEISLRDMRYTVGFGGRLLLSAEQRVNARLDIGWGLDKNSGFNKRNMGIYVFISEAF